METRKVLILIVVILATAALFIAATGFAPYLPGKQKLNPSPISNSELGIFYYPDNQIPDLFPKDIILPEDAKITEIYSSSNQLSSNTIQYAIDFTTSKTPDQIYKLYFDYFAKNKFALTLNGLNNGATSMISARAPDKDEISVLSQVITANITTKVSIYLIHRR
jgi:hypothetical protein